jgi:hypothetical protein
VAFGRVLFHHAPEVVEVEEVHSRHAAHRGRHVPGYAQVHDDQRSLAPAGHRGFDLGHSHHVVRCGGAAEHDVALPERGGQIGGDDGAAMVVLGEGAGGVVGAAEPGEGPRAGGDQVLGGNLGHAARTEDEHSLSV